MTPTEFAAAVSVAVEAHPWGTSHARKLGRNSAFPYVPVIHHPTYPGRAYSGDYRQEQLLGLAYATPDAALDRARRCIIDRKAKMRADLHDPRMRALRRQHGLPENVPTTTTE